MIKTGKAYESLVHWINQCLHDRAIVKFNERMTDKDTGQSRQIDISIRLSDGPTEFLAIVEARDRSRPVGIDYVAEVKEKRDAVGADAAFIVSRKGFYGTAIEKAKIAGIRLFTLEEALRKDWSHMLHNFSGFTELSLQSRSVTVYILDKDTGKIVDLHDDVVAKIRGSNAKEQVFVNQIQEPRKSLFELYQIAVADQSVWEKLEVGIENAKQIRIFVNLHLEESIFVLDKTGSYHKVDYYCVVGDFWIYEQEVATQLVQYRESESGKIHAEVLTAESPGIGRFELLFENPDDVTKERKVFVKLNPPGSSTKDAT